MAIYKNVEGFKKLFDEEYKKTRELISQGETHLDNLAEGFLEADRVIQNLPTADVVEVVRCRDCIYFVSGVCRQDLALNLSRGDDYCSYGERKEQ